MINIAAAPHPAIDLDQQAGEFYDATVAWFSTHWLQILIAAGAGVLLFLALHFVKSVGKRLCDRDASHTGWGTIFGRAFAKTNNLFIAMAAAQIVVSFAQFADAPPAFVSVVHFLFTIVAVFQSAIWAREIILGAIEHRTTAEDYHGEALINAMGLIRVLVSFALFAIALVLVLGNLGVNVTGLIAGLGVGGIAIGLAAQSIFADLFAAIAIIFDRPFKTGDAITFDKSAGTVERIGMRSTRIRGATGEARIIGNKKLLDNEIVNNTQREFRRVVFTLGLVQQVPADTIECLPTMVKEIVEAKGLKFVRAGFTGFSPAGYDFNVEFDSPSAAYQDLFDARHTVGIAIIRRFAEAGIGLAYPPMTVTGATPVDQVVSPDTPGGPAATGTGAEPSSSAVDQDSGGQT
ncbi:MAG: mechanosensitive ion channel family protein [Proteobacteria bacterium]|nr:mechanosensitive ion channel family protein [Pseudomonadota bacterium]